jgi:hypothetical protein
MQTSELSLLLALCLSASCGVSTQQTAPKAADGNVGPRGSLGAWQIIGEGTGFLAVQVECPQGCASLDEYSAAALDAGGLPVRRITAFPRRPEPAREDVVWFFFVLFDPTHTPPHLRESRQLRFSLRGEGRVVERTVDYAKTWGFEGAARIFDAPLPPEAISGTLVLCDFVFLAQGDPRPPVGPHVSVLLHGAQGSWNRIEAVSGVLDAAAPPELRLEADRGWLELATGRSHSMREAIAPARPYIDGWWDGKGCFHPDPPTIR